MKPITHHKLIFSLLCLLFISPGLIAYVVYIHPEWLPRATTNKGHFLTPPPRLSALMSKKASWQIILWSPSVCDTNCITQLDQLARLRIALGRRFYDVQLILMQSDTTPAPSPKHLSAMQTYDIRRVTLSQKQTHEIDLTQQSSLFIANPAHYLVLSYPINSKPDDLFHDIKLLLTHDKGSF
jgi:hypothetical protein